MNKPDRFLKQYFFKFLTIVALVFFVSACDETTPEPEEQGSLIGVWAIQGVDASNCTDPDDEGFNAFVCTDLNCVTFEFKSDLTFEGVNVEDGVPDTVTGTYTVDGNQYSISADGENVNGNFTIDGNSLTLNYEDPDTGCDIEASLEKQ